MELQRFGDLDARVVGDGDELIVVLLHGFGAPGDDLVSLARAIEAPRGTRFVFPAAPITFNLGFGESRGWWKIDLTDIQSRLMSGDLESLKNEVPEGLDAARAQLERMLDQVQARYQVAGSRIVLGGFSQGAMLSLDLALTSDRPLAGVILFSGTIICGDKWRTRFAARSGISIVQSHGRFDPVLPFAFAEELQGLLSAAGFRHTWVPFMGGHEIPRAALDATGRFLRAL